MNVKTVVVKDSFIKQEGRKGVIATNVRCSGNCTFCYEKLFSQLFPKSKTVTIPKYDKESFEEYNNGFREFIQKSTDDFPKISTLPTSKKKGIVEYYPNCDFFSLGLSLEQIEQVVKNIIKTTEFNGKKIFDFYTNGYNLSIKTLNHLKDKYSGMFGIHLSAITFNKEYRRKMLIGREDSTNIKALVKELPLNSTIYFLFLDFETAKKDLDLVVDMARKNNINIWFSKMFYNRINGGFVRKVSNDSEPEFKKFIFYLKDNTKYKDVYNKILFSPHSKMFASAKKKQLLDLLGLINSNEEHSAVFCSNGAYDIINRKFRNTDITVVRIDSAFGGTVDFSLGITFKTILLKLEEFRNNGTGFNKIYIPSTMLWVDGMYDANGDGIDLIENEGISVEVIPIPYQMKMQLLNIDDCYKYYGVK